MALRSAKYFPPHPHLWEKEKGRNRNADVENGLWPQGGEDRGLTETVALMWINCCVSHGRERETV